MKPREKRREDVEIRSAKPGDESEIANVHLNSWREAYRDLLSKDFLNSLPLTFRPRKNWWGKVISQHEQYILQVAEAKSGIVGFACLSPGRDPGKEEWTEVQAIYLLEGYKGLGIGFDLLSSGLKMMIGRGFKTAYCWVLENNPTIKFYERSGASFNGLSKVDAIGDQQVTELCYEWSDLNVGDQYLRP